MLCNLLASLFCRLQTSPHFCASRSRKAASLARKDRRFVPLLVSIGAFPSEGKTDCFAFYYCDLFRKFFKITLINGPPEQHNVLFKIFAIRKRKVVTLINVLVWKKFVGINKRLSLIYLETVLNSFFLNCVSFY